MEKLSQFLVSQDLNVRNDVYLSYIIETLSLGCNSYMLNISNKDYYMYS